MFLGFVLCLETFLTPERGQSITNTVAENAALILGSSLAERKGIKSRVKDFYATRSAISHGGDAEVDAKDLNQLGHDVHALIEWMIKNAGRFRDVAALQQELNDRKLR